MSHKGTLNRVNCLRPSISHDVSSIVSAINSDIVLFISLL